MIINQRQYFGQINWKYFSISQYILMYQIEIYHPIWKNFNFLSFDIDKSFAVFCYPSILSNQRFVVNYCFIVFMINHFYQFSFSWMLPSFRARKARWSFLWLHTRWQAQVPTEGLWCRCEKHRNGKRVLCSNV